MSDREAAGVLKSWSRSWFLGGDLRPQKKEVRTLGHGSIDGLPGDRMKRAEVSANGTRYGVSIDDKSLSWREGENSASVTRMKRMKSHITAAN